MSLEILSKEEMYDECLKYCHKRECQKLSGDRIRNCKIINFCGPIAMSNGSRLPNLSGIDLEKAYETIKKER